MPRQKTDPLIAALIAKIPPSSAEWPVDGQIAWLNMMAMAFDGIYGGGAPARFSAKASHTTVPFPAAKPKPSPALGHPFIIDENSFVRNTKTGKRVNAKDVDGSIFDMRGMDGDMRTILWADGSAGVNGKDFVISA